MKNNELLNRIRQLVVDIFAEHGIDLVDLTYKTEGRTKMLKILADTETGITVDQCARMNELVGAALDNGDFIDENYILEVSSPGLDRPLKTKKDFIRMKGRRVCVFTYAPVYEKKEFVGPLETVEDRTITVLDDNAQSVKIPYDKISKATQDYKHLL